jgi:hypothetical protein
MEEAKDKTQSIEQDFYRPKAEAQAQTSRELGRRLELLQKISVELKVIREETAKLGDLTVRVERVAAALRELEEQERNEAHGQSD